MKTRGPALFKSPTARRIRLVALGFALLSTVTALAQYLFLRSQTAHRAATEFHAWASELIRELDYNGTWDLRKYRQAEWDVPGCAICTNAGTVLDVQGFVPGLLGKVAPPQGIEPGRCVTVTNEIGEHSLKH